MQELVGGLQEKGVLYSAPLLRALAHVDRADFVPEGLRQHAYQDIPLPIGYGQTISQPYTVVFMLERLNVQPGQNVLEVGFGSGWQTALLAHLVGPQGMVHALEIVPELCAFGSRNLERYPELMERVRLYSMSARAGLKEHAPFDRIIAAAEVKEVPGAWREQLCVGGVMVYPHDEGLVREAKDETGFTRKRFPGFSFVPFV